MTLSCVVLSVNWREGTVSQGDLERPGSNIRDHEK